MKQEIVEEFILLVTRPFVTADRDQSNKRAFEIPYTNCCGR